MIVDDTQSKLNDIRVEQYWEITIKNWSVKAHHCALMISVAYALKFYDRNLQL
jgi:hypothetical protein